ncbi:Endonuclease/exonuclease/phosphatase [Aspergillus egyptiacus]|nr:Endonuclease/exonuclease/phosphatase [Aspergillus egyptiacus]
MAHDLSPNQPNLQPFHYFDRTADPPQWRPAWSSSDVGSDRQQTAVPTDQLHLISWNIDFATPAPRERMSNALQYLQDILSKHDAQHASPVVIFFQEMVASDLELIQQAPWVRDRFYITDLRPTHWRASYGTSTLVDRRLSVQRVFRIPYVLSTMQRDGLFVDLSLSISSEGRPEYIVRLCNTHLESLASGARCRPVQLKLVSEFMHGTRSEGGLPAPNAAILAGDLNAFAPEDAIAPTECGLQDAFLVLGGVEDTEEAYTWGKQNPLWMTGKFPDGRLDKVLFCGALEVVTMRKIAEGLKARVSLKNTDATSFGEDEDEFEDVWVTDHFGLATEFKVISEK